jgi:hypothetical protein
MYLQNKHPRKNPLISPKEENELTQLITYYSTPTFQKDPINENKPSSGMKKEE